MLMFEAVRQNEYAHKQVASELKAVHEFVLEAGKQNEYALKQVASDLKADHEFRLAAVRQHGRSLDNSSKFYGRVCIGQYASLLKTVTVEPVVHVAVVLFA